MVIIKDKDKLAGKVIDVWFFIKDNDKDKDQLTGKVINVWLLSKFRYKPKVAGMSDNELIPCWYSSVRERRRKAEEEKRGIA